MADKSAGDTKQDDVLLPVLIPTLGYHTLPLQFSEGEIRIAAGINPNIVDIPVGKHATLFAEKPFRAK